MRRLPFALALVLAACGSTQTPVTVAPVPVQPPTADASAAAAVAAPRVAVPTPGPARDVHLPPVRATTLANGLAVQLVEYHTLPVLHLRLVVRAGSAADPANLPGLASFTGDMLREGTTTRTSAQIAEAIEFVGGSLSVSTSADVTVLSVSVLRDHAETALSLLADVVGHPTFPQVEINKLKRRETDRLQQSRNDPGWLTRRAFYQGLYGEAHPYGRFDTTPQVLARLTRADLMAFHRTRFVSGNMFLTVVGDVQPAAFDTLLNRTLGTLRRGTAPAVTIADAPAATARQIVLVDRPESAQSVIRIGNVSLRRADPDWVPFTVANQILGGGVSSRLFMDLRELRSLSYGVYARMGENVGTSQWFAGGQVRTAVTGDAMHALFRHIECLTTEAAPDPELSMTRSYLTDSFALSIETPGNVADLVSSMRVFGLPADYYDTLRARVMGVDAAASLATARRYIHPDQALVVVVGTASTRPSRWGRPARRPRRSRPMPPSGSRSRPARPAPRAPRPARRSPFRRCCAASVRCESSTSRATPCASSRRTRRAPRRFTPDAKSCRPRRSRPSHTPASTEAPMIGPRRPRWQAHATAVVAVLVLVALSLTYADARVAAARTLPGTSLASSSMEVGADAPVPIPRSPRALGADEGVLVRRGRFRELRLPSARDRCTRRGARGAALYTPRPSGSLSSTTARGAPRSGRRCSPPCPSRCCRSCTSSCRRFDRSSTISDTAGAFFLLAALVAASGGRLGAFAVLFVLGALNRETILLSLIAVALSMRGAAVDTRRRVVLAGCLAAFVIIKSVLYLRYIDNPGPGLFELTHQRLAGHSGSHLADNLQLLATYPRGAYVVSLVFGPLFAGVVASRTAADPVLKSFALVAAMYGVALCFIGDLDDLRELGDVVLPLAMMVTAEGLGSSRIDRSPRRRPAPWVSGTRPSSVLGLVDAEDVALRVLEPRGLLRSDHADVVDGLQAGQVVVLEHHAAVLELVDLLHHVGDLEAQGGVLGPGSLGLRDEGDGRLARARQDEVAVRGVPEGPRSPRVFS